MALDQTSSLFSRKIVNLFAAMAFGSPNLPTVLREGNYSCHWIETTFSVGSNRLVNPEIILCSDTDEHTLIIDAKSGANLKESQLSRYALVDRGNLEKNAFVSSIAAKHHNILIIGIDKWKDRLLKGSSQAPSERRVLAIATMDGSSPDLNRIEKIENNFSTARLDQCFTPSLSVDWDLVPNRFLPVDIESEDWEFAEILIPEVSARILDQQKSATLDELASELIYHWPKVASKYKVGLKKRMKAILKRASQQQFAAHFDFDLKREEVKFKVTHQQLRSPSKFNMDLRRKSKNFMNDIKSPQLVIIYGE